MPRIEITLSQIQHNARMLCELYGQQGISLMGVSKALLGEPLIAEAMIQGGFNLWFKLRSRFGNTRG
jgi:predicted amino acid racemase